MTRTGFSGQKLGQLEIAQRHAFRDQFRSMRRLLVLACLVVVAAARPTDQAKAKLIPVRVADDATTTIKPMMDSLQSVVRRSPWDRLGRYWSGAIA